MDSVRVLTACVETVLTDEGFQVHSSEAQEALAAAASFLDWCGQDTNKECVKNFSSWLFTSFSKCFQKTGSFHLKREKMWSEYHQICTSKPFRDEWKKLLDVAGVAATPTFYQFVSNCFFKEFIKNIWCVHQTDDLHTDPMSREDENALRYVAGHVCRKIQTRIDKSSCSNKEDMILFIMDLSGDEADDERGTEDWTNAIDRGGLWHVNDNTYMIFTIVEEEICKQLKITNAKNLQEGAKKELIGIIMKNEDLLFQWALLSGRVDDDTGMKVLDMIVQLYVTIRGFAFATSCLELYKQAHKIRLQKSKALRREIQPSEKN